MDLDHVRTFVTVVEASGFRRASKILGLSQPTVSRQVSQVEQALGASLLVRGPQGMTLTASGEAFLVHARHLLASESEARRQAGWGSSSWTCRVGVVDGAGSQLTRPLLRGLAQRLPTVEFTFVTIPLPRYEGVVPQDVELVLAREPWRSDDVRASVLFEEPVVLVVPHGSPLADASRLSVHEALDEPLIGIEGTRWSPLARYWTLADHGDPHLVHPARTPAGVAETFRTHQVNGVAPRSVLPSMRHLCGPFATATLDGVGPNRAALLSRRDDGRRVVDEVHRCARGLAEVLVPLVMPSYVVPTRDAGSAQVGARALPRTHGPLPAPRRARVTPD